MTFKSFLVYGALPAMGLMACAPVVQTRLATFNQAEYEPYGGEGTATISGEAFLRTRAGDIKKGAGNTVYLNPVTTYSTEWFERAVLGGEQLAAADEQAQAYERSAVTDSKGRFTFERLPPGEYYVACPITWKVPGYFGYAQGTIEKTGGWVYAKVKIGAGRHKEIILKPATGKKEKKKAPS
ncbi:MAG TPA: carboxypeptidase-like regulatory domain-containing protein [Nitrospiraceae bacterium]|nr:carboxypeptidase-like regulatory domain-containing protein [Nitrospiraceae bacterium]